MWKLLFSWILNNEKRDGNSFSVALLFRTIETTRKWHAHRHNEWSYIFARLSIRQRIKWIALLNQTSKSSVHTACRLSSIREWFNIRCELSGAIASIVRHCIFRCMFSRAIFCAIHYAYFIHLNCNARKSLAVTLCRQILFAQLSLWFVHTYSKKKSQQLCRDYFDPNGFVYKWHFVSWRWNSKWFFANLFKSLEYVFFSHYLSCE